MAAIQPVSGWKTEGARMSASAAVRPPVRSIQAFQGRSARLELLGVVPGSVGAALGDGVILLVLGAVRGVEMGVSGMFYPLCGGVKRLS
jgi:hypothetical protein